MKLVRWAAVAALTLLSLMNLGAGTSDTYSSPAIIGAAILGIVGLVAVFGLLRRTSWGVPAAIAVSAVNVVAALIALAADSKGAAIGLTVSVVALALCSLSAGAALPVRARTDRA